MKKIALILMFFLMSQPVYALHLTDEQYANLDLIHQELKKKDVNFIGFNGSKDDMKVYGMSEEQVQKEIDKMDLAKLKEESPKEIKKKALIAKFEAIGFDEEMLEWIGLGGGE